MLTRVFKSGNSLAVRIPREVAVFEAAQEVEIERRGDSLLIRPAQARSLAGVVDAFAAFPPGFMAAGRERHAQKDRMWD